MTDEPLDQFNPPSDPKPKMPLGKVALINFGIMLLYMTISGIGKGNDYGPLIIDALAVLAQTAINIFGGVGLLFFPERRHIGKAMLLAGLLVGVIGFGACFGKYSMFG